MDWNDTVSPSQWDYDDWGQTFTVTRRAHHSDPDANADLERGSIHLIDYSMLKTALPFYYHCESGWCASGAAVSITTLRRDGY